MRKWLLYISYLCFYIGFGMMLGIYIDGGETIRPTRIVIVITALVIWILQLSFEQD
jgi:hypothetical protein